jgi:hypothetical protein
VKAEDVDADAIKMLVVAAVAHNAKQARAYS